MVKKLDTKQTIPAPGSNAITSASTSTSHASATPEPVAEFGFKPGELESLGLNLIRPPKFPVGTTVPERVYLEILRYRSGISQFIEDAINDFDGDMHALVKAATSLSAERQSARFDTGVRSISGRVPKATLVRLQGILAALKEIRGMSLAKVLGGLVLLHLSRSKN